MYGSQGVKASNAQLDKLSRVCLIVHYLPPLPLSLSLSQSRRNALLSVRHAREERTERSAALAATTSMN